MNEDYNLILKFIQKCYPVIKVKHNGRFKRAIISDLNQPIFLSNETNKINLRKEIINSASLCLNYEPELLIKTLENFLPLK